MGGIGKTTLARYAYDDPLITEHFQIRAWVTVSQDYYSAHEVLLSLLDSLKESNIERFGRGFTNEEKVRRSLKGKRYLIVLDDIWSTKAWDDVRRMFPDDVNGSRVMLTTRLFDVAAYASCANPHFMRFMNADQSWALLCRKVFGNKDCPDEIKHIGRKIAKGCRGLPLAIVLIGGLLSTVNKTRASWGEIAENVNSAINATRDGQFEEILSLSYNHLPHHLRPCFLYMAGFPNDYEIHVSTLIRLWVAEGFMKPMEGSKTSEKTAERHFLDLVKRNLVLVMRRKSCNGKIKTCSIHDLVRDLCIKKAHEEKFFVHTMDRSSVVEVDQESTKNQCRASVDCSDLYSLGKIYGSNIRTIMTLGMHGSFPFQERYNPAFPTGLQRLTLSGWRFAWKDMKIVGSLPNLQVLKLKDSGFKDGEKWETAEGEFPQLKFLLIEKSQLEEWATESSHFPSLKCLQLHHCPYLREIPCVIGEIPTLELIEVKGVNKSLVESAKQIQKEQQDDWGNFALQVRCFNF